MTDDVALSPGQCHVKAVDAASGKVLPDPTCTPGAVDPGVTQSNLPQTICRSGYSSSVRPPAAVSLNHPLRDGRPCPPRTSSARCVRFGEPLDLRDTCLWSGSVALPCLDGLLSWVLGKR